MRFGFITSIISLTVFLQSPAANAEAVRMHQCERTGVTRTVELQADNDSGVPCRILYHRPMEDQSITNLWNAKYDAQFCSTRYDAFIVKLETKLNWSCELTKDLDQSLAENELLPESETVASGAAKDDVSATREVAEVAEVAEAAEAVSSTTQPLTQKEKLTESSNIGELKLKMDENASTEAAADTNDNAVESVATITPNDSPIKQQRPDPVRALPSDKMTQNADPPLSEKPVKQHISSGNAGTIRMHQCERAGVTRTVDLQADNDSGIPCRVLYYKPMEDQSITNLWNARNDAQFCSTKYDAFIVKLETQLNWSCELIKSLDQSLAASELLPESGTVASGAPEDKESSGRDSAEAASSIVQPLTQKEKLTEPSNIGEQDPGMDEIAGRDPAAVTNDIVVENVAVITPDDAPVKKQRPKLARALPINKMTQNADPALSMKLIKQYIPSGNYVSNKAEPHSGNSTLCPADGFFIWNTKSPDKPVFEMGVDHQFHFDLASLSDLPVASVSQGVVFKQCLPQISAGYCSNEKYIGDSTLHSTLSSYFGCDGRSENPQNRRSLVLLRTLTDSNSNASECTVSENYHYLALAPSLQPSESAENNQKHGIELVILPKGSNADSLKANEGSICRYIQGG